jgi:acyl-CoA synthetase (AMP-forming)/AMP-acid ligase II
MTMKAERNLSTTEEIRQQLIGPGGPFEICEEEVRGERMNVFKNRPRSMRDLLLESAIHGENEYIVHGERRIRYREHLECVARLARGLSGEYGIGPGDRVALLAANSADWVITWWAVASLGGILSALNGLWTPDEIRYGLDHSEPRLLIGDRKRLDRIRELDLDIPTLEIESGFPALLAGIETAEMPTQPIAEDDPCLILYTSGTTGRPKGAVVSHRALVGFVKTQSLHGLERFMLAAQAAPAAPTGDEAPPQQPCSLVTVPLFHLSGLYAAAIMMLAQGAKTVYRDARFDPEDVMRLIEKEKVTAWSALGSAGPQLLNHPALGRYDLSSLRNIGFGGAPTSPDLQQRMVEAFPNARGNIGLGYGLSESGGMGTTIGGRALEERPASAGRGALAHQIEIWDPDGKRLPTGEYGEIHIRSPYLMLGYWRDPEATAEVLKPHLWLATGDIGCLDEEGYLFINSRARDMILRSGENVYPVEIEHRIDAHPGVSESAVIGVDHPELGQAVKAVVVLSPEAEVDAPELTTWVGETLAGYKVPSEWEIRREPLPRNAAGKVLKKVLTGEAAPPPDIA